MKVAQFHLGRKEIWGLELGHETSNFVCVSNFRLYYCSKKFQMLRKNVKSLLEQLQVCIFAEIVFGVRCTLSGSFGSAVDERTRNNLYVR